MDVRTRDIPTSGGCGELARGRTSNMRMISVMCAVVNR
jgi:hypothetical protein